MSSPRQVLAHTANVRVDLCSCALIHVHVGPVTLHLERGACETLATTLATAMVRLTQLEEGQPSLTLVPRPSESPN
ncbi:MAG: hypothetical protein R3A51_09525 [Nannocystaceae bacterium]|nr:hypothetical protein [Myxococcales bacterium]